jgi:hypothetical protein
VNRRRRKKADKAFQRFNDRFWMERGVPVAIVWLSRTEINRRWGKTNQTEAG